MNEWDVTGIIPARYGSTRFPGKPLAEILDRPMVLRVVDAVRTSEEIDRVIVATDDHRIQETVESEGAEVRMTSSECPSGSDRVSRVAETLDTDYVVNIQGDEPLIRGEQLDRGIRDLISNDRARVGSFMAPCPPDNLDNPDHVKVAVDRRNDALYFSRSPIPHQRETADVVYQHIGIYIFRREFLLSFRDWKPTPLERAEKLEQLRILENGHEISMTELEEPTIGVDREGDIELVEEKIRNRG